VQDGLSVVSIWTVREEAYSPRVRLVLDHLRFDLLGARFLWQVVWQTVRGGGSDSLCGWAQGGHLVWIRRTVRGFDLDSLWGGVDLWMFCPIIWTVYAAHTDSPFQASEEPIRLPERGEWMGADKNSSRRMNSAYVQIHNQEFPHELAKVT
jgi:hypothetical protein